MGTTSWALCGTRSHQECPEKWRYCTYKAGGRRSTAASLSLPPWASLPVCHQHYRGCLVAFFFFCVITCNPSSAQWALGETTLQLVRDREDLPCLTAKSFQKWEKYGNISSSLKRNVVTASIKIWHFRWMKGIQRYVSHSSGNSLRENNNQLHVTLPEGGKSKLQSCVFSMWKITGFRDTYHK